MVFTASRWWRPWQTDDYHGPENLNVKSAMLHVLGDAAASFGVIVAGLIIWRTGWTLADPIASILISLIIFISFYRLIRDSFQIMMIRDDMKQRLKELFGIEHTTIQLEGESCGQGMVVCPAEKS